MAENSKTLKIGELDVTRPVVEGLENKDCSIFKDQYDESLDIIDNIISLNRGYGEKEQEFCSNNIVSFIGPRGSGKTSCMLSVAKMLEEIHKKHKFHFLKMIDPSFFDAKHNILELIIGNMYYEFSEELSGKKITLADRTYYIRDLQESFQKVKHDLIYLNLAPNSALEPIDEELEQLRDLSAGVNLAEGIHDLVCSFLKFMGKDNLVISIDDIDLNISEGYTMMEQLRKYVILPNVLILMSLNLDQMRTVIQQSTATKFPDLIRLNIMGSMDLSEMSERYLEKVLPLSSRIYLPAAEDIMSKNIDGAHSIGKEQFLNEIQSRCGYRFYNGEVATSYIIPRNLREFNLFGSIISKMREEDKKNNRKQFQNYLFNSWTSQLDTPFKLAARKLMSVKDPAIFNKQVINVLRELYNDKSIAELQSQFVVLHMSTKKEYGLFFDDDLKDIVNENNQAYNISIGDVAYLLNHLIRLGTSENIRKLIFFIKTLYTIKLTEYAQNDDLNSYRELIGGAFFCLTGETLIGIEESTSLTREIRLIDGKVVKDFITKVEKEYESDNGDEERLHIAEFMMLAVSHYVKELKDITANYRLNRDIYYDRDLSRVKNIQLNILSPLFNTIDKERAYGRFSNKIFDIAKKEPSSLVNTLPEITYTNYEDIEKTYLELKNSRKDFYGSKLFLVYKKFYNKLLKLLPYDYKGNGQTNKSFDKIVEIFKNIDENGELGSDI